MRVLYSLLILVSICISCKSKNESKNSTASFYKSNGSTDFRIDFKNDSVVQDLLLNGTIYGSSASVAIKEMMGQSALEIKTNAEFSDAFIDLEKLFGHTIDFTKAKYVSMNILSPKESWITALKFNFKDAKGNFGGCNEIANNFYGNHDRWMNVIVNMQKIIPEFKNWHGTESPLSKTKLLSLNPYNAHQADSSAIYIKSIALTEEFPSNKIYDKALAPKPSVENNTSHTITFDEEEQFRYQIAYRAFESSFQALSQHIAENKTRSIRLKGSEENKHIAFLPILDKLTGAPVDFTKVKRIHFSYYLTEDSDNFNGATLFLANEHWKNVLVEPQFYTDFRKGKWCDVSIDLDKFDFQEKDGNKEVLPNVYEIRFGLNYVDENKDIEMWLDNFGWE